MRGELDLRLEDALREAFEDTAAYLARQFTKEIRAERWDWPTDPSPRDIVDTGNLAKSLRISFSPNKDRLEVFFNWTAPYSGPVHDGAVFKATDAEGNPRTLTARPWTRVVLRDPAKIRRYFQLRFHLAMRRRALA